MVRPYDIHVTLRNVGIRDNIIGKVFGHTLTYVLGGFKERNVHRQDHYYLHNASCNSQSKEKSDDKY